MNATVTTYALYLVIALPLTVWVARNLFKNGRIFLVDCFHGNESLADSVNQLLVMGLDTQLAAALGSMPPPLCSDSACNF